MHVVFIECILRTQVVQTQFNYFYDDLCEEKIAEMDKYIGYKDQSKNEKIFFKNSSLIGPVILQICDMIWLSLKKNPGNVSNHHSFHHLHSMFITKKHEFDTALCFFMQPCGMLK